MLYCQFQTLLSPRNTPTFQIIEMYKNDDALSVITSIVDDKQELKTKPSLYYSQQADRGNGGECLANESLELSETCDPGWESFYVDNVTIAVDVKSVPKCSGAGLNISKTDVKKEDSFEETIKLLFV
ncbi:hypothetical protein RF11_13607 [Thelohanellus kitauei]|uniref:Uncharacterized protein n=1 Tax=Thelohanellus kitauei TaxID=669202 RepID=A0A0C2JB16_THEKT|nr:hypothetical protein RF11_13607 [Thelohanellus kitauei]